MAAWQAGIVVVASAGNTGPEPMTIGVPGNVPYVITVGAMTDNYTPDDPSDDYLASFSAAGPTVEGFVKPDLVAPGGHMLGTMHLKAEHRAEPPGIPRRRQVLHHVRHLPGHRGGLRRRRPDAAGRARASPPTRSSAG